MPCYALRVGTQANEIIFLKRKDRMKRLLILIMFMGLPLCAMNPPPENDPLFLAIRRYEDERCGFHGNVVKRKSKQVCIEEVRSENRRFWESPGLRYSMWFLASEMINIRQALDRATDPLERTRLRCEREQVRERFREECIIRSVYWFSCAT